MPSRASTSAAHNGHGLERRRPSRQHQISRFATDQKPLSPRSSQGLKFKDKAVKTENSIYPPHSNLPFEFVKNANNVFVVQTKSSGNQQQPKLWMGSSKDDELIKYMSKVPGYLQRGEKLQDNNVLNFGVLDWGRLEQWTHQRDKLQVDDRVVRSVAGSCSSSETGIRSKDHFSISDSKQVHKVDFSPVVKPLSQKSLNCTDQSSLSNFIDQKEACKKDTSRKRDAVNSKYSKCKERLLGQNSGLLKGKSSSHMSNSDHEFLQPVSKNLSNQESNALKSAGNIEEVGLEPPRQYGSGKQESIVLLLPKDFSGSRTSEVPHRASLDGKSAEYNWGSFSDIFSVDEIQPDESFSQIPHSCPLNSAIEAETELDLDLKLDTLIKSQGLEVPVNPSQMPVHSTKNHVEVAKYSDPNENAQSSAADISGDRSRHRGFTFGLGRMTRSLSFRESSAQPPLSSTYVTAVSGPAKSDCSTNSHSRNDQRGAINGRAKSTPLRRLLDPLLKSKIANHLNEHSRMKPPPISIDMSVNEKPEASTIKALLNLTIKNRLLLFKFVVEETDEIFASTVKTLSTLAKDDMSWLYTFYSVHRIRKRNAGWKGQKVKPCGFGYNVVGQMKVSEPRFPSWCKEKPDETQLVRECILYNVDTSKAEAATSDIKTGRELAAIVVSIPKITTKRSSFYNEYNHDEWFSNLELEKLGQTVVILPGGDHSLPHEGSVPSSLINRWRSGGLCDCGGWDVGCKLRILTDKRQQQKYLQVQCDLYDEGEAKGCKPFFSLIPLRDGLFSVEFDAQISSLQAFSISVALISSRTQCHSTNGTDQLDTKHEFCKEKGSKTSKKEGPEKHPPFPPLSPVGRV
ncbi:unnamed protein product [Amaranthus hypochondriacus]